MQGIEHFGRPLADHLIGTHDLLAQWGNPVDVCLAGLFHSVYGTKTFRTSTIGIDSRNGLRALIGKSAEELVFVFGMSDRRHLLLQNPSPPYCWKDYRTGELAEINVHTFSSLIEIEVANFIEQLPVLDGDTAPVIRDMRNRFEATSSLMSRGARKAFRYACSGSDERPIGSG